MFGSDGHGSASYVREADSFPCLIGSLLQETSDHTTNIILLSVIYTYDHSLGRKLLFDSLASPFGA